MSYDAPEKPVEVHHREVNPTERATDYINNSSPTPAITTATPLGSMKPKISKKKLTLISIIVLILLLVGGGAYAYFFTNLKYRIPWLRPDQSKLVAMMYENFATLKGADFSVSYEINVGDRDLDAEVPESKRNRYQEKRTGSRVASSLSSVYYAVSNCHTQGKNLQYQAGKDCDGSEVAKPVAKEPICEGATIRWPDLKSYDGWEYGVCNSDHTAKTWSVFAKTDFNEDKVTCANSQYCKFEGEDDDLGMESDEALDFLSGEWWDEEFYSMEESIPTNFKASLTVTGKGFAETEDDKLPNFEIGVEGFGKFGSMSMLLDVEARVIDEYVYYKVDEFPFLDITKGHMNEWIQTDENQDMWGEFVPEAEEANRKLEENFSAFIADTAKYEVLEFIPTGEEMEINGIPALMFDVSVNAENIPTWLEEVHRIAKESEEDEDSPLLQMTKESFTEAEKIKLVEKMNKVLKNLKFTAALNPIDGHLMYIGAKARLIPPADSKQFGGKQFNFIIEMKMWNQNNPSKIEVPVEYVSQDEIEREEMDLSVEEYGDYKQASRVSSTYQKLSKYHTEHKKFPDELSEVTRLNDYNTGKPYGYEVKDGNYYLTYVMNATPDVADQAGSYDYYNKRPAMNMGTDYIFGGYYVWHDGNNVADRYSPVADQYWDRKDYVTASSNDYDDADVVVAIEQAKILKNTKDKLTTYRRKYDKYPDNLEDLAKEYKPSYYSYNQLATGFLCEDLTKADWCGYSVSDDGYTLKASFPISSGFIREDPKTRNAYKMISNSFGEGENSFAEQVTTSSVPTISDWGYDDLGGIILE